MLQHKLTILDVVAEAFATLANEYRTKTLEEVKKYLYNLGNAAQVDQLLFDTLLEEAVEGKQRGQLFVARKGICQALHLISFKVHPSNAANIYNDLHRFLQLYAIQHGHKRALAAFDYWFSLNLQGAIDRTSLLLNFKQHLINEQKL